MNRKLRMLLFSAALLGLTFMTRAVDNSQDWMPIGDDKVDLGTNILDGTESSEYYVVETGGVYVNGDRIWGVKSGHGYNGHNINFQAIAGDTNTLNIYGTLWDDTGSAEIPDEDGNPFQCSLKIDGNVHIDVLDANTTATVNVVKSPLAEAKDLDVPTIIEPYIYEYTSFAGGTEGSNYSLVVFNVATGNTLFVNIGTDITFRGRTVGKRPEETLNSDGYVRAKQIEETIYDMVIVFKGAGQTKFVLADGTIVSFNGGVDKTHGITIDPVSGEITWSTLSNHAAGTKVFLCMDQAQTDVNNGQSKVVFERDNTTNPDARSMVFVGYNSLITYLSDNKTGLVGGGTQPGGCAALAFDPSNVEGSGRLILFLKGAYDWWWDYVSEEPDSENPHEYFYEIHSKYPFNDAAVIVAGHYVPDFSDDSILDYDGYDQSITSDVDYSIPAGITAKFNIIDNNYYNDPTIVKPVTDDPENKRLLWVINDVQNHGTLASDPYWYYWNSSSYGYDWAWFNNGKTPTADSRNVRHGFIIGINGVMDIYDNTGLAFVAGALNQVDPLIARDLDDGGMSLENQYIKARNPSALIIDNVDESLFAAGKVAFTAGNPFMTGPVNGASTGLINENAVHAQILLRGNGVAYFMEAASSCLPVLDPNTCAITEYAPVPFGYIFNFWAKTTHPASDDPVGDPFLNYEQALAVGQGGYGSVVCSTYDGWQLSSNDMTQPIPQALGEGIEGIHVLDVEGKLSTHGLFNTTLYVDPYAFPLVPRSYDSAYDNGTLEISPVVRDWTGMEIDSLGNEISRPLLNDGTQYPRYNSPAMYLNFNAQLFNTILRHDDATKYVDGVPSDSDPAYTGGEVYFFSNENPVFVVDYPSSPDRYRMPELRFFNSSFELHESACTSGVRFVYRDIPTGEMVNGVAVTGGADGNNLSTVTFFDHGDVLDSVGKGFGRALVFSSTNVLMSDGSYNYATESSFVNVYKGNMPLVSPAVSSTAQLTLLRADEYPDVLGVSYLNQNAHHLFMLSQPDVSVSELNPDTTGAHCWMLLGWPRMTTSDTLAGTSFYPDTPDMVFPFADSGEIVSGNPFPAMPYDTRTISNAIPFNPESVIPLPGHVIFPLDVIHPTYPATPGVLAIGNGGQTPSGDSDGTLITFGSWNKDGYAVLPPVTSSSQDGTESGLYVRDGIIYDSHGGKVTITTSGFDPNDPSTRNYKTPVTYFDTMVAKLLWNDWDYENYVRDYQFSGIFDLPADQVVFSKTYAVQPWGLTTEMMEARGPVDTNGLIRIDADQSQYAFNTPANTRYLRADESGVEEMLIGWHNRDPLPSLSQAKGSKRTAKAVRKAPAFSPKMPNEINKFLTRATESPDTPVVRPTYLFYIGPEDDIKQLRVAGATMADPFCVDIGGDGEWPIAARVREIVSQKTEADLYTEHFIGEGAHAVLFGERGGTIGLGTRDWNENSLSAWNLLGKEYVSIAPLGDMTIMLNSDLIVADNLPLIATTAFGSEQTNRLTFYSDIPREIRVPSGCVLDLSAFGQGAYGQEIEFAGQVRLVLEDGAAIRFPSRDVANGGIVLYFNDDSQFIFEGREIPGYYDSLVQTDYDSIKLIGKGDIWLNKNAKMLVNGDVRVAVESDRLTPQTSITLSMRRQSACYIGDESMSGGIFQVGNTTNLQSDIPNFYQVRFTLEMNGTEAMFQINRGGFFGLGAGIINNGSEAASYPNGDATVVDNPKIQTDPLLPNFGKARIGLDGLPMFTPDGDYQTIGGGNAWEVTPLYNVYRTSVEITEGVFQHNNIADGSDSTASLMAYGPSQIHRLRLSSGNQAIVRGGGNLMFVPWLNWDGSTTRKFYPANIWNYAGKLTTGEAYTILGSAGIILNSLVSADASAVTDWNGGRSVTFDATHVGDWNSTAYDMFRYFGFYPYEYQQAKRVCLGATQFAPVIGFVNLDVQNVLYPVTMNRIVRLDNPGDINGDVRQSLNLGYVDCRSDGNNDPDVFGNRNS